jgi:hypothetical protein
MVNSLVKELEDRNKKFKALAPTNTACRIINGGTIHKFKATFNKYIYIYIYLNSRINTNTNMYYR